VTALSSTLPDDGTVDDRPDASTEAHHRWARAARVPEARRLRLIAATRIVAITALAAIGSFWPHPSSEVSAAAFAAALAWLPWALVVFIASDAPKRRLGRYGGWVGDLAALGTGIALVPVLGQPGRFFIILVVLIGLYSAPELPTAVAPLAGLGAGVGGTLVSGSVTTFVVQLPLFALALLVVTVAWRLFVRRDQEAARVASWLRDRADTIADLMPEPVVLTDGSGQVLRWNPVCGSALGLRDSGESHCASSLALHHGERPLDCASGCALLSLVGTGADRSVEVWRPLPDGQRQPLLASVTPVVDPNGRISEVVHCFRDITRLKEADEAKTLFLATASHELKTPLTVIRGFGEMLHSGRLTDPEAQARAFEAIHLRSMELARVVDRLLLSSRIDAGRLSVRLDRVDVVEVVTSRAWSLEASTRRPITVDLVDDPDLAWADVTALTTVVDHLLDNAVKYSPDGQRVEVTVHPGPSTVVFEVRDHGIGMTAEQAAQCFEKFWQADSGDRRRFGGTGIGLYIVRSLVESMGGQIDVTSTPGDGTTFIVSLANATQAAVPVQRHPIATPERSIIREFMRQIGVPGEGRT